MHNVPNDIDDAASRMDVGFVNLYLEVAHLPIEGKRHLSCREGHGEIRGQAYAIDFYVFGKGDGTDDGAWTYEHESAFV